MKRLDSWLPTSFVVCLVTCFVGLGCAVKSQAARAPDSPVCTGTQTVVVHNGTARSVEVVLGNVVGASVSGGPVVEVVEPGQQSLAISFNRAVTFVYARDESTGQIIESPRLRFEYGCNGS